MEIARELVDSDNLSFLLIHRYLGLHKKPTWARTYRSTPLANRFLLMKMRSWLLTIVAALSGFAMLATPAEAGNKKHHRHHYWEDKGRYSYYNRAWDNRGYGDSRPYDRGYIREPYYYGPVYDRGPVIQFRFQSN